MALWNELARTSGVSGRLRSGDCRQLVQSVDVWLNVPRRPLEASGTSGEKVAINGGLNLSILDGWWLEAYDGTNGFAIGTNVDLAEAVDVDRQLTLNRFIDCFGKEVIPLVLPPRGDGLPQGGLP